MTHLSLRLLALALLLAALAFGLALSHAAQGRSLHGHYKSPEKLHTSGQRR